MDSYKKDNPETPKPKQGTTGNLGGQPPVLRPRAAGVDSFHGTGTLRQGTAGGTRKLGSTPLEAERTLEALRVELENGQTIASKLEGRIAVLYRAMRIVERPIEVNQICQGISAGEANFTKQVAKMLQGDPQTARRVQVALYQWDQANKGLAQSREAYERALQYEGEARVQFVDSNCHVEKLRGQLYPLINLHVVFRDNPLLAQLIPTPKINQEPPLPPPPPPPQQPEAAPSRGSGSLGALGADPNVQQVVTQLREATGSLRNKLIGMLGGVPKDEKK